MNFVKERQSEITLTIAIILIALVSFGAGRLTAPQTGQEPIIIQGPSTSLEDNYSASVEQSLEIGQPAEKSRSEQGRLVGSINSNKYHWPDCPWAKKIAPENQIWFGSEAEAQAAGYTRCGYFEKYTPIDRD